jgi:hypothetical protein
MNGGVVLAGNAQTGALGIRERGTIVAAGGSLVASAGRSVQIGGELMAAWSQKAAVGGTYVVTQWGGNIRVSDGCTIAVGISTGWFDAAPRLGVQVGASLDLLKTP